MNEEELRRLRISALRYESYNTLEFLQCYGSFANLKLRLRLILRAR